MKKVFVLCLIFLTSLSITSCRYDKMYVAYDFSYFVMDNVKYIPIELAVQMDLTDRFSIVDSCSQHYYPVYNEKAAKGDIIAELMDLHFDVEVVSTPFYASIISVYSPGDSSYFYCLPEQYDLLNEHYSQIKWTDKLYIDDEHLEQIELQEKATAEILSKPNYYGDTLSILRGLKMKYSDVWQIDSTGCFLKRFGTILRWGDKVYFYRGHNLEISYIDTVEEFEELPELELSPEISQTILEIYQTD